MGGRQGTHRAGVLLAVLIAASLAATTASCGSVSDKAAKGSPTPKQGGTCNYPLSLDYFSFDPAVLHQVCEGLVRYEEQPDGTLKTVPCLAESWSGNADATVWTFKLRRGVMFQAPVSREVTAADVVAALRFMASEMPPDYTYVLEPLKGMLLDESTGTYVCPQPKRLGVAALDRYTVRFTLRHPFSEFPDTTGSRTFWVWPVDYVAKIDFQHLVGTGPYRFQRVIEGKSIDLVRNRDWWDTSGGPYIDTIHCEVFSSVPSMMLAFQMGRLDWTSVPKGQIDASRSLPQVKSGQWRAESTPTITVSYLCFNMKDPVVGGAKGLRLRQLLSYACDRQAIIDTVSDGTYRLPTAIVPPGVPGSELVKDTYPYGPAKAAELAKQVGPVTLDLVYPTVGGATSGRRQVAEILAADYAKLGITLRPKGLSWTRFWEEVAAGRTQVFLASWVGDYPSLDTFLYPLFESRNSGTFGTFYSNPQVDALLAKARATPSQETRVQNYAEAERLVMADAPLVPIWVYADFRLLDSRVANVRFNSMGWPDLWRAWVK
jgi:ABC-type transport system substrate-binding protein